MAVGVGFTLNSFHDVGAIDDEMFLAIMIFVIAVCAGIIIAMDLEQKTHLAAYKRWQEIPPPVDSIMVWPPEEIGQTDRSRMRRRANPVSLPGLRAKSHKSQQRRWLRR